jgi:hypothetical protein
MWYDDAKLHRYVAHHPMNSQTTECHERFGEASEVRPFWRLPVQFAIFFGNLFAMLYTAAAFHTAGEEDPAFMEWNRHFTVNLRQSIEAEERQQRSKYSSASFIRYDWDKILGSVTPKTGDFARAGRFVLPESVTFHPSWARGAETVALPDQSRNAYLAGLKALEGGQ